VRNRRPVALLYVGGAGYMCECEGSRQAVGQQAELRVAHPTDWKPCIPLDTDELLSLSRATIHHLRQYPGDGFLYREAVLGQLLLWIKDQDEEVYLVQLALLRQVGLRSLSDTG
jgi:hypothetical protein